jgi:lysophospholipase L1-like esterase
VVCLAAEGAARWLALRSPFLMIPQAANCLQRDPALSTALRADCHGNLAETEYTTNSLGFRGPPLRDDGSVRILALGDSCTWGWRVAQAASYPARLQALLDTRVTTPRYQVLNAGVPGYTSVQGLTVLETRGMQLHPAIVLFGFGWNDSSRLGEVAEQIAFERRWQSFILFDDFLLRQSRLYRWARFAGVEQTPPAERLPRVALPAFAHNVEALVRTARDGGAHVLALNFIQRPDNPWRRSLEEITHRLDVPLVPYTGPRLDLVHPTAEGDRMLAEQVFTALQSRGWIPR